MTLDSPSFGARSRFKRAPIVVASTAPYRSALPIPLPRRADHRVARWHFLFERYYAPLGVVVIVLLWGAFNVLWRH